MAFSTLPVRSSLFPKLIPAAAAVFLGLSSQAALAQQSSQPIKIIVPSTPGGGSDVLARLLADSIGKTDGVTMVIENRPGASNTIGTDYAARSAPDGQTVLMTTPEFVIAPHLRAVNYDPVKSFEPICYLTRSPQAIVVHAESPYKTLADLFDAAKKAPGTLTLASSGPGSRPHIAIEKLKRAANVNITYVPYAGSGPAIGQLMGKHLTGVMASYPNVVEPIRTNKLHALAVAAKSRIEQLPQAPTVIESGFPDFEADLWYGVVAPAKTPKESIDKLTAWFTKALQVPEVKAKLAAQGMFPVADCGVKFAAFIEKESKDFGEAIKASNIKAAAQ